MQKYIAENETQGNAKELIGYLENYHYAFVEYQGGTLGHWDFADDDVGSGLDAGLCALRTFAEAFLIADGDIRSRGTRAKKLEDQLKERVHIHILPHIFEYFFEAGY